MHIIDCDYRDWFAKNLDSISPDKFYIKVVFCRFLYLDNHMQNPLARFIDTKIV